MPHAAALRIITHTKHRVPNSSSHRSQYNVFSMRREQIQLLHNRDFAHRLSFRRTAPRGSLAVCFKTPRTAHGKLNFATIFAHAAVSIPRPTTRFADSMKAELRRCSAHPFQSRQLAAPIEPQRRTYHAVSPHPYGYKRLRCFFTRHSDARRLWRAHISGAHDYEILSRRGGRLHAS